MISLWPFWYRLGRVLWCFNHQDRREGIKKFINSLRNRTHIRMEVSVDMIKIRQGTDESRPYPDGLLTNRVHIRIITDESRPYPDGLLTNRAISGWVQWVRISSNSSTHTDESSSYPDGQLTNRGHIRMMADESRAYPDRIRYIDELSLYPDRLYTFFRNYSPSLNFDLSFVTFFYYSLLNVFC